MKTKLILLILLRMTFIAFGQGTFTYDQQSTNLIEGSASLDQSSQPMGQSFTPGFSSIAVVRLFLYDGDVLNNLGSTVYVNLRSNSITGTILSSTMPVFMPDNFFGITNFFFPTPLALAPGVTYYLQPLIQSGSTGWGSTVTDGSYIGGTGIYQGNSLSGANLWFQEGTIAVPEPASTSLIFMSGCLLICLRIKKPCSHRRSK